MATYTSKLIANAPPVMNDWLRSPWLPSNGNWSVLIPPEIPQIVNNIYQAPGVSSA